jgi:hypothetical protein
MLFSFYFVDGGPHSVLSGVGFFIGEIVSSHAAEGFLVGQVEKVKKAISKPRFVV